MDYKDLNSRKFIGGYNVYKALNAKSPYASWYSGPSQEELDKIDAAQRAAAEKDQQDKKKKDHNGFWDNVTDAIGGGASGVVNAGAEILNYLGSGGDRQESLKRTADFMRTSGAQGWGDKDTTVGNVVGGIVGGIPEAVVHSGLNTINDVRASANNAIQHSEFQSLIQAQQNWRDNPQLMAKTLKNGQTAQQAQAELADKIKNFKFNKDDQEWVQNRSPLEAAGDAAMTFLNAATLGGTGAVLKGGEVAGKALVGAAERTGSDILTNTAKGLATSNIPRKIIADTLLTTGQVGAQSAGEGEAPTAQDVGIGAALAILAHGKAGLIEHANKRIQAKADALKAKSDTLTGNATEGVKSAEEQLAQLDSNEQKLNANDPQYLKDNGLIDEEAGKNKAAEIMQDPAFVQKQQEATKAVQDANKQLDYYNAIEANSPYHRQVNAAEQQRQADIDRIEQMAKDPQVETSPEGVQAALEDVNNKYKETVAQLDEKYPEDAMQRPVLQQTKEQVTQAKLDAQDNLDRMTKEQYGRAYQESQALEGTPDPEKVKAHLEQINQQRQKLNTAREHAETVANTVNKSEADVDKEIATVEDGTHPEVQGGSKTAVENRLLSEKSDFKSAELVSKDPKEVTPTEHQEQGEDIVARADAIEVPNDRKPLLLNMLELTSEYMRYRGLNKLADLYDDSVRNTNKANYHDANEIKKMQKLAKGIKSKSLFKAADGDREAYAKLSSAGKDIIDWWRGKAKEWGKQLGLADEVLNRPYIPHIMGNSVKVPRLIQFSNEIKDINAKIASGEGDTHSLYRQRAAVLDKMDKAMGYQKEEYRSVSGKVEDRFLKERKGAEGYKEDFWLAVHAYSRAKNTKLYMEDAVHDMAQIANNTADKGVKDWLENRINNVKGGKAGADKALSNFMSDQMGIDSNKAERSLVQARRLMSLAKIGYSVNSVINSSMQLATIPGVINADGAVVGFVRAHKLLTKLAAGAATDEERALWRKMHEEGIFEGDSQLLPDTALTKIGHIIDTTAFAGIKGADRYMRVVTYLGAQHKGMQMGLKGVDLDRFSWRMTNKANQNFSKLVAPKAFESQVSKNLWSMMTFLPGTVVRAGEVGLGGLKGVKDLTVIGHSKLTGKAVTAGDYRQALDSVSKALFMGLSMWGMSALIGNITGNGEVVPNPLSKESWQTPATSFIFGSGSQTGVMGLFASNEDNLTRDDNGNIVNKDLSDRQKQFLFQTLPSFLIPGYAQASRSLTGYNESKQGYGANATGKVQFVNDPSQDLKRTIFGKYSTTEGQNYVNGLSTPEGGPLTANDSATFKGAPKALRNQYYDFFKSAENKGDRAGANSEISSLYKQGKVQQARRKAAEWNAKMDALMAPFYEKYKFIDPDLQKKLNSGLYINITPRGEKQRENSGS